MHLEVVWENVAKTSWGQFEIPAADFVLLTKDIPYDYLSIMHYGRYTFVKEDSQVRTFIYHPFSANAAGLTCDNLNLLCSD